MGPVFSQPFVRLIIPYISGIILFVHFPALPFTLDLILGGLLLCITLYILNLKYKLNAAIFGFILNIFLFSAGYFNSKIHIDNKSSEHFSNYKPDVLIAKTTNIKKTVSGYRCELIIISGKLDSGLIPLKGKALGYFKTDSNLKEQGIITIYNPEVLPLPAKHFSKDFDARKYYYFQNIHHRIYVDDNYKLIRSPSYWNLKSTSIYFRDGLINVLARSGLKDDVLGVVTAMVVGFDDEISRELLNAFSSTGTLHALSVSGMHVGIIYIMIVSIFGFIRHLKYGKIFFTLITCGLLWLYAFVTGLSPSVLRAVTMFSFMAIANCTGRKTNIFNTLCVSGFFLLLYNPFFIVHPGFQLSYLAVLGIVTIYPGLAKWFETKNFFLGQLRDILLISISAQLTTLPLSLFYFGQFPVWFLLSNILVVPLSSILLYGGIGYLFIYKIPYLSIIMIWILNFSTSMMNNGIKLIDRFPMAVIREIHIDLTVSILLYLIIYLGINYFIRKSPAYIYWCLTLFIVVLIYMSISKYKESQIHGIWINNHSGIASIVNSGKDSSLIYYEHGTKNLSRQTGIQIGSINKSIFLSQWCNKSWPKGSTIIITEWSVRFFENCMPDADPELIIADAGLKRKSLQKVKDYCQEKSIPFYSVKEQGPIFIDLN